ncbi:MAG: OmpA family protein, partial [Candidatus Kapaibacterium sp.]
VPKFAVQGDLTPLETYYEILNITGSRMQEDKDLTIELNGCVSEKEAATVPDHKAIGLRRAEAVATYLQETWDIPASRIRVRGGGVPPRASRERTHEGVEENQRVEITSTRPDFNAPLVFKDTVNQADVSRLRLDIDIEPGVEIESWNILATQGEKTILGLRGRGAPERVLDVELDPKQLRRLAKEKESVVTFTLIVDQKGVGDVRVSVDIPVTLELIRNITSSRRPEVDKYTMMLFDFDKDLISEADMQLVKRARARIDSLSRVTIIGSSDPSGSSEYNLALAERRARRVKDALGIVHAEYRGELLSATDAQASTPEGRFHGRTVRILVQRMVPTKDE